MNKFKCKNGCSGKEGFSFEGNIWCSGSVDGTRNIDDGDQAPSIEVISYECNECGESWDLGKDEKFHIQLKIYRDLRNKALEVVRQLKDRGVAEVYVNPTDEMMDIMRLTCIENGIRLSAEPGGVAVRAAGQGFEPFTRRVRTTSKQTRPSADAARII